VLVVWGWGGLVPLGTIEGFQGQTCVGGDFCRPVTCVFLAEGAWVGGDLGGGDGEVAAIQIWLW